MEGAVLAFGGLFALWRVRRLEDITPESLAILDLLRPVPGEHGGAWGGGGRPCLPTAAVLGGCVV